MAHKFDTFLKTIEFLFVAYILLDLYASIFVGLNSVVVSPRDRIVRLNATNEDPKIVGIGNFAVDEYNRLSKSDLKLQSVVKAVLVQSNYMLLIQVTDAVITQSKQYGAVVQVQNDGLMRLIAFEEYMDSAM